ncbi:hypothetical protein GCM10009838_11200 [Catenulispora subtropica]|uniref:Uncharacterized protein n=1 Tax=Catenulispora subtropica TaxID=450798 RepID=A0ABP5C2Z8_9ACTN
MVLAAALLPGAAAATSASAATTAHVAAAAAPPTKKHQSPDSGPAVYHDLSPTQQLDSLSDRIMYRLAYRNFGDHVGSTSPTNGDSSIAQTFTAGGGGTLSFWYNLTCPDTLTYDWATATLTDNTAGTTATVLAKTCVSSSGWTQVSSSLTAGHSYTLTLTSHDDNYSSDPTYTLYDDVVVS